MKKMLFALTMAAATLLTASSEPSEWAAHKESVMKVQQTLPGWCSFDKANRLMDLILETQPTTVAEIGVFGGASVYPMAHALRYNGMGIIYAIDPWTGEACVDGYDKKDVNAVWWSALNLEQIFSNFRLLIESSDLDSYCSIMRARSQDVVDQFADESIDILHIDGNHTEQQSTLDVINYLPKVKSGGYIWFDDCNWPTTQEAVSMMMSSCEFDQERSISNSCYLFRKP